MSDQNNAQPPAQDFDAWLAHPYTKVLMKSMREDYVPKDPAQQPVPLTRQEIAQGFKSHTQFAYGAFEDGVRFAEKFHGIGVAQQPAQQFVHEYEAALGPVRYKITWPLPLESQQPAQPTLRCPTCNADRANEDCRGDRLNCGMMGQAQQEGKA